MKVGIRFGILAPPIRKQLREQKVRVRRGMGKEIAQCEKDGEALSRLTIRGLISERQRDEGRKKLMHKILQCCQYPPVLSEEE